MLQGFTALASFLPPLGHQQSGDQAGSVQSEAGGVAPPWVYGSGRHRCTWKAEALRTVVRLHNITLCCDGHPGVETADVRGSGCPALALRGAPGQYSSCPRDTSDCPEASNLCLLELSSSPRCPALCCLILLSGASLPRVPATTRGPPSALPSPSLLGAWNPTGPQPRFVALNETHNLTFTGHRFLRLGPTFSRPVVGSRDRVTPRSHCSLPELSSNPSPAHHSSDSGQGT